MVKIDTPEEQKEDKRQKEIDEMVKGKIIELSKKPQGTILIPLGVIFGIATFFSLLCSLFVSPAYFSFTSIIFALFVIDILAIYYGYIVISETQCPMFEHFGHKVGVLSSDVYLIDLRSVRRKKVEERIDGKSVEREIVSKEGPHFISLGGLNVLFPWEKVRKIPGFDYTVVKNFKPGAISDEEEKRVPGPDYFIPHTRKLDIALFDERQKIEFARSAEGNVEMYATVRVVDPDKASYSGTDVLIVQVPRLIENAARDIFWTTDINTIIGLSELNKEDVRSNPVIQDIARRIMDNIDMDKLRSFGFEVFNIVIADIELSPETIKSRTKLQDSKVELLNLSLVEEIEAKKVDIEKLKAQQRLQTGIGENMELGAIIVGQDGEATKADILAAMNYKIQVAKYGQAGRITLIESGNGGNDTVSAGAALGAGFLASVTGEPKTTHPKDTGSEKEKKKEKVTIEPKEGEESGKK